MVEGELIWKLLYTKPHAEIWADANLRKQGFETLMPLTPQRAGFGPLFPRYVFAGHAPGRNTDSLRGTFGVQYVVCCGEKPSIVPASLIAEIRTRMDAKGVVAAEQLTGADPMFARRQRERLRAIAQLSAAGFRVRIA
jgi:hypothetical protein